MREARQVYLETERCFLASSNLSSEALETAEKQLEEAENSGDTERAKTLKSYIRAIKTINEAKRIKNLNRLSLFLTKEQQETLKKLKKFDGELKNPRYAVGKNPENRTENQEEKLRMIEANSPTYEYELY